MTHSTHALQPPTAPRLHGLGAPLLALFFAACALTVSIYQSMQPLAVIGLSLVVGAGLTCLADERLESLKTFLILFSTGWLMVGVGGFYAEVFRDPLQLDSDAGMFFDLARSEAAGLSLDEVIAITESVGAIIVWRAVYDALAEIGIDRARYVGLAINVVAVSLSGVLAARACQRLFPGDTARLHRMRLMLSLCGLFWLYSAVHLRDAAVLLLITSSFYVWLRQLLQPGLLSTVGSLGATAALAFALGLLRQEFFLVPVAIAAIALLSRMLFETTSARSSVATRFVVVVFVSAAGAALLYPTLPELTDTFSRGTDVYREQVELEAATGSLGNALVVQQPAPVRAVVGLAYMALFPVPVWSGLQLETAGAMFKSLNALFFYAFVPLFALSMHRAVTGRGMQRHVHLYMVGIVIVFGVGVALTSLESRHFGAFLVPAFCAALLPDLGEPATRRSYLRLLIGLLACMAAVHLVWAVVKLA